MNALNLASSSLFNNAKFVEAYEYLFQDVECRDSTSSTTRSYQLEGQQCNYVIFNGQEPDDLLSLTLTSYLVRKYDSITPQEAFQVVELVSVVVFRPRLSSQRMETAQSVSTKLVPGTLNK
ncbi:hypothetical protein BWQ96_08927 [Gracilariopsis chorda]|uniref:Uncharacterized protein n=1 Tax=Gracilariopsis chorda TaxID=448386 RepID=A0A2V3IH08_9FLOR|nr:hypothetical protein BWQ96_08927 [Gracilariopsis chorda]|eukprot:PXF41357.1 hypothetical protein BWQ96_08927 [Gracilariopsis chorda]